MLGVWIGLWAVAWQKPTGGAGRKGGVRPQFRSFLPWHMPWHLTSDEARCMSLVVGHVCRVAAMLRDWSAPPLARGSRLLVREPRPSEGGWAWADTCVEPPLPNREVEEVWASDEAVQAQSVRPGPAGRSSSGAAGSYCGGSREGG